jgi:phosphoribosylglycinamide formyltransferase 2
MELGTPKSPSATRALLLGSGVLGREVAIELIRLGVEVIACDRYADAPAMQVAHRSHVFPMLDASSLRAVVEQEQPDLIIPEIEAIATDELVRLEREGFRVVPTARAASLTMNREGIRRLAAEELGLPTSSYAFAASRAEFGEAVATIGMPCVVKPIMSSSGKGQSVVRVPADVESAWEQAQIGGRTGAGKVIVEGLVDFDYEITLLTVRHGEGVLFCEPIGHVQHDGDYRESWQPAAMSGPALTAAHEIAGRVTAELGGTGIFGVELFVRGDSVIFSEVSPRPHDTGLVTLVSQDLSEFALHARAVLGLPVPRVRQLGPSASAAILPTGDIEAPTFVGVDLALAAPGVSVSLFGKPAISGRRRMGVALASADSVDQARTLARRARDAVTIVSHRRRSGSDREDGGNRPAGSGGAESMGNSVE